MPTVRPSSACPCHSKQAYRDCCRQYHLGTRYPETVEALLRSRYAAFALGLSAYLVDTLHPSHPEAKSQRALVEEGFRATSSTFKFTGLRVLEIDEADPEAMTATFVARLFERGVDNSFAEKSLFRVHNGRLLYAQELWTRAAPGGELLESSGAAGTR